MAGMLLRRVLPLFAVLLCCTTFASASYSCPFCSMQGETLTTLVDQANLVLYGTLKNAQLNPGGSDSGEGSTDLAIDTVIKSHEIVAGKKMVTLPRYVPTDKENKYKFLVFCDVYKGKIDPYRGMPVKADSNIDKYIQGALAVRDKPVGERLRFFFDYLENPDIDISNDALKEFGNAGDYKAFREMAKKLPPDKVLGWLKDPNTPAYRYGLYASILSHCGKEEHAQELRKLLDDPKKRTSTGVDGLLAAYATLKPKEGWDYVLHILKNPAEKFTLRYAALRTTRFFHDQEPNVIPQKQVLEAACLLLDQNDIADLVIEDLRKWKYEDVAGQVVGLYNKPSYDIPHMRRSILRYALTFPGNEKAAALVAQVRQSDPKLVKDVEELLKADTPATPAVSAVPTKK